MLLICLTVVFAISVFMLILDGTQGAKEEHAFKELAKMVDTAPSASTQNERAQTAVPVFSESRLLAKYQTLYEQNPDFAGWIRIDGTLINYPVMYTPDDGDFYLDHGFDKEKTKSGVPFIDERCAVNPLGTNTIIYGHHMKNGTMFADLEKYRKKSFYTMHPTVHFDTLYAQHQYEIIAAFESQIYEKNDQVFKYYNYVNVSGEEVFHEYMENIKALSLYDTGVTASYGDTLLTLITCAYHTENGRFVMVAKRK